MAVKFISELQKIKAIKDFADGTDSQRTHLNELVAAVNQISDTARKCVDPKTMPDFQRVVIIINGQETPVNIPMEFTV